jgi:hypothetical protein
MEEFDSRREKLITQITAAFNGVSRGDGVTLHQANVRDDDGSAEEEKAARDRDQEKRWQDVPAQDVTDNPSVLSFLDVAGFRYYIPVFMIYALTRWDKDEASARDSCAFHLIQDYPKSQRQSEARDIAKKYEFNAAQVKAVAAFLRFIVDFDEMFATPVNQESLAKWEAL